MSHVLISTNPLNNEEVGRVRVSSAEDISATVDSAKLAQKSWAALRPNERKAMLDKAYEQLATLSDRLIQLVSQEMGKDYRRASYEVMGVIQSAAYLTEEAVAAIAPTQQGRNLEIQYRPLGVVAVISPWNYPLAMANNLIIPALIAGNTVVLKPSDVTPLVAEQFVKVLADTLPPNVINIVHGDDDAGKSLVKSDIHMVAFTGSVKAGKDIMENAAPKLHRLVMELGGNDPMIVLDDADIDAAAQFAVASSFENAGQMCTATERVYVDAALYDQFIAKTVDIAARYRTGPWHQRGVNIGPLANEQQHRHVLSHLSDAAAKGALFELGSPSYVAPFIEPTVLSNLQDNMLMEQHETFGPIVAIAKFESIDEAIARANNSAYGLGAVVFGHRHAQQVADAMEAGMVAINSSVGHGNAPWVGAKQSGIGYHGGIEGHRQFTQIRVMSR